MTMLRHRVIIIGDTGVGKSNIASRFIENKFEKGGSSGNVSFAHKGSKNVSLKDSEVCLDLIEASPIEKYRDLNWGNYSGSRAAIIVYSITVEQSYLNVPKYIQEVKYRLGSDIIIVVVGNKNDLEDHRHIVSPKVQMEESGSEKWYSEINAHLECSALTGDNIKKIFDIIGNSLLIQKNMKEVEQQKMIVEQQKKTIENIRNYIADPNNIFPVEKFLMWGGETIQLDNGSEKTVPKYVKIHWDIINSINKNDNSSYANAIAAIKKRSLEALSKPNDDRNTFTKDYYTKTSDPEKFFSDNSSLISNINLSK